MASIKPRILMINEASFLQTGYAVYGKEVLRRLYDSGKYEIAELATYAYPNDDRANNIPWKFYGNLPDGNNPAEVEQYNSQPTNQFGEWRMEDVLLDFKPHIVFNIQDWWMMESQERSPFRKFFSWHIMPTVDAYPQNEQWLSTYKNADYVFTYTDWAKGILDGEGGGLINTAGTASPAADEAFRPLDNKKEMRASLGLENAKIIGTVMRNQKRKLFPDLFETFAKFLEETKRNDVFLYCHTSFPDVGWDIPKELLKHGIGHKVLFTYVCKTCQQCFPSLFADAATVCPNCNNLSCVLCNVQNGISNENLNYVYNMFDLYVQYANSEGLGMPQLEAASAGIPVMAVDYSGMHDVIQKIGGAPLKYKALYNELETGCNRAIPDNEFFLHTLKEFFNRPEVMHLQEGNKTRQAYLDNYSWDNTAQAWEKSFDAVDIQKYENLWNSPPKYHTSSQNAPENQSTSIFVDWLVSDVLGEPDKKNSYMASRLVRDLNYGVTIGGAGGMYINDNSFMFSKPQYQEFTREKAYQHMVGLCERRNQWESKRGESNA